jgi:hypothetical protein
MTRRTADLIVKTSSKDLPEIFRGLLLTLNRDEELPNHATHFFQRTTTAEHLVPREKELNEKEDYQSSSESPTRR